MSEHIDHVLFSPFHAVARILVEETVVSVPALCRIPLIEVLEHHHEAHFVAKLYQFLGRHVVRCAYRVTAHVLEDGQLASEGRLVDCGAYRTEIVVHAYTLELPHLSVEVKAFLRAYLYASDTEAGAYPVEKDFSVLHSGYRSCAAPVCVYGCSCIYLCISVIELRTLGRPESGSVYVKLVLHLAVPEFACVLPLCHHSTVGILDDRPYCHGRAVLHALHASADRYGCVVFSYVRSSDVCAPDRDMYAWHGDVPYLSEKSGSRVPA